MIDCHCHLAVEQFDHDRRAVLERAQAAGVSRLVVVGEDVADSRRVLDMCRRYPGVLLPALGLHPDRFSESLAPPDEAVQAALETLAREHRRQIVALGEVGLDYWRVRTRPRRRLQRLFLERMAALARELDLPLNVHSRSAGRYILELLGDVRAEKVLLHAFDGKAGMARQAAQRHGWVFSIPPSVIRSRQKQKLVRVLDLEHMALESDSPALGPDPGRRNEPLNMLKVVGYIADIKQVPETTVVEMTTANAARVFGFN
jgi:TatD DNase family protein